MNDCYLVRPAASQAPQSRNDDSFIGGIPKLPPSDQIPRCKLCGEEQSFVMQVAFPANAFWAGYTLAIFTCTSCADEQHLIPEMIGGPLRGATISGEFLESYQKNFRFLVFETALSSPQENYRARVKFKRLDLVQSENPDLGENKVGGHPTWLLEDEAPGICDGRLPMRFLLQLMPNFQFAIHADAPPQIELGLDGSPQASPQNFYQLFNGNAIYLFGTDAADVRLVYAITQI
jgi:hypothetical protein